MQITEQKWPSHVDYAEEYTFTAAAAIDAREALEPEEKADREDGMEEKWVAKVQECQERLDRMNEKVLNAEAQMFTDSLQLMDEMDDLRKSVAEIAERVERIEARRREAGMT